MTGPEMARLCNNFEDSIERIRKIVNEDFHHEQKRSVQNAFMNDVKTLTDMTEEFWSPFTEESKDLLVLDTRDIVNNDVIDTLSAVEKNGKEQCESFVQDCLIKQVKSVFDPINRNKLHLFSTPVEKKLSNEEQKIVSLKNDFALFSRLYISCQTRHGNLEEFFTMKIRCIPLLFLSQNGSIKSSLFKSKWIYSPG